MKALTWLADSRSRVKSFRLACKMRSGYALSAAQSGEKSVKAKALYGLGGSVMEMLPVEPIARCIGFRLGIDLCDSRLPEEVQGRDRDPEIGDRSDPAAAQTIEKRGEGCGKEKSLNGSPARATYSLTSAWLTRANT